MPTSCCVFNCTNRFKKGCGIAFYRFPKNKHCRFLWKSALKRKSWDPSPYERVCGCHFATGKWSNDEKHPDFVPSLKLGYEPSATTPANKTKSERYVRALRRSVTKHKNENNLETTSIDETIAEPTELQKCDLETTSIDETIAEPTELQKCDLETTSIDETIAEPTELQKCDLETTSIDETIAEPTELQKCDLENIQKLNAKLLQKAICDLENIQKLNTELQKAKSDLENIHKLNAELHNQNASVHKEVNYLRLDNIGLKKLLDGTFGEKILTIGDKDKQTKFYTGLPCHNSYIWLLDYCLPILPTSELLTPGDVLFLLLVKLKLNLRHKDIADRFHISPATVSRIFNIGLPNLAEHLKFLIKWPEKELVIQKLPKIFKTGIYRKSRVIIDCTEIFVQRAKNLTLRASTWSNYKHHNTLKILIGITPTGLIAFISRAFGGRVSDKMLTQQSGFLDLLEDGDLVLADRGFLIEEDLASRGASLAIPAFTRGKTQLSAYDVEKTRRLARVRIHVERAILRIKNFHILSNILPISLVPHIDNILVICGALSNLQPSLIQSKK